MIRERVGVLVTHQSNNIHAAHLQSLFISVGQGFRQGALQMSLGFSACLGLLLIII